MPLLIVQDQPYQLPGMIPIKFTPSAGNFVRVWVTAAPKDSKLEGLLAQDTQNNRVEVHAGATADIWTVELDKGGAYVFLFQEYQKGSTTFRGGYGGDPSAYSTETKVGVELSRTIYIGERVSMKLGTGAHGYADLVLYCWEGTIRQTTIALHGETTPAVLSPTSARVEAAVYSSTVAASVAALIDLPVSSLLSKLTNMVAEMIADIPKHMNNTGGAWHTGPGGGDSDNDTEIERLPTAPGTPEGFARVARILNQRLSLHMQNGSDGGGGYHAYPDFANALIADPPPPGSSNMVNAWASIADVYRAYEAHRQDAAVHGTADTVNVLATTLDPLLVIHRDFLEAVLPLSPPAPVVSNPGVIDLAQLGFRPDPLLR
jgi:hypothetical protein